MHQISREQNEKVSVEQLFSEKFGDTANRLVSEVTLEPDGLTISGVFRMRVPWGASRRWKLILVVLILGLGWLLTGGDPNSVKSVIRAVLTHLGP